MAKHSGLGRGLDAIFMDNSIEEEVKESRGVTTLRISHVEPRKDQPRKTFDSEALAQLADSIAMHGVIQPILVRDSGNGFYEIIAGERRWRASKLAGLTEIPALVVDADELKVAQMSIIENIQREDLNVLEEAQAYDTLMDRYGLTQEEVAEKMGKSRSAIANLLRLLDLPDEVADMLNRGELSAGHARALLGLKDRSRMAAVAQKLILRGASVREAEALVKAENRASAGKVTPPTPVDETVVKVDYLAELERRIRTDLGRRVKITDNPKKKTLEIEYQDNEDLEVLLKKLCGADFFKE
jgi:ParB family chromosome partitioning protein